MNVIPLQMLSEKVSTFVYADPSVTLEMLNSEEFNLPGFQRVITELKDFEGCSADNWMQRNYVHQLDDKTIYRDIIGQPVHIYHVKFTNNFDSLVEVYYLTAEGVEVYDNLFVRRNIAPKYLTIIHPGWGAHEVFEPEGGIFYNLVMRSGGPIPEFIFSDRRVNWPEYDEVQQEYENGNYSYILFSRTGG